jgi:signal transduction histidine kinase
MAAQEQIIKIIDWFIPHHARIDRSERSMARNFVFTHLFGPAMSQSISVFLFYTDPNPGIPCWIIIASISLFWALPFVYRATASLQLSALLSVALLAFTSLFGAYFYGGVSSPFLPWMLVSLLIGFFYLSERPFLVISLFAVDIAAFCAAYFTFGFPQLVSQSRLVGLGWISIASASLYMSWMAIYYASILSMRSELERETERHRETGERLRKTKDMAEAANHAKSIFLAKMSHELRTPLNAVIGFSEILLEDEKDTGGHSGKIIDLERINAAGKHLLALVTDVLDLSKIESDYIELKLEKLDLNGLIDDVLSASQSLVAFEEQQACRQAYRTAWCRQRRSDKTASGHSQSCGQCRQVH